MSDFATRTADDELRYALYLADKSEVDCVDPVLYIDNGRLSTAQAQVAALCAIARALIGIGQMIAERE